MCEGSLFSGMHRSLVCLLMQSVLLLGMVQELNLLV
jgi:hypothetical protein